MSLLRLNDVSYAYGERDIIRNATFSIDEGEIVLLAGGTGSGKSTLIRIINGLIPHFYSGRFSGKVIFDGKEITQATPKERVALGIRTVMQFPENQLLGQKVEKLLKRALGEDFEEIVDFLELKNLLNKRVEELSGGEKQRVAIAMVLGRSPKLLLLDEPFSQLDVSYMRKLIKILLSIAKRGVSILIAEHRVHELALIADKALLIVNGKIVEGKPYYVLSRENCKRTGVDEPIYFSIARRIGMNSFSYELLRQKLAETKIMISGGANNPKNGREILRVSDLWFWYRKDEIVLQNINFNLREGEILAILGRNGAGKTTLLKLICGMLKPKRGEIRILGEKLKGIKIASRFIAFLPQNPEEILFERTVRDEISFSARIMGKNKSIVNEIILSLKLEEILERNPLTLSGGEKFLVAFASILVKEPKIVILDETTRGLDSNARNILIRILKDFTSKGGSVIMATNDIDLLAELKPDRIIVLHDGKIVLSGNAREVLMNKQLYDYGLRIPLISELFEGVLGRRDILSISEINFG